MNDISVRFPVNDSRKKILEDLCVSKKQLPGIRDVMFKPISMDLNQYHPNKICLRLREFSDGHASLIEIQTVKAVTGYSDEKKTFGEGNLADLERIAKEMNFEKWGEMSVNSTEYTMSNNGSTTIALVQNIIPVGEFIKIESPTAKAINNFLKELNVSEEEKIERNAAVLLGEHLGLIAKP